MIARLNWTEWQYREAAAALEARAAELPANAIECRLNLSLMQLDLLTAAEECLSADRLALRQEYDI